MINRKRGIIRFSEGGGGGGRGHPVMNFFDPPPPPLGHPFLNFFDPPLVCSRFLSSRNSLFNKTLTLPKRILRANKCCMEARNV